MSEHDANRAMTDTARLRLLPDTREDTQRMTVVDRRYRARQGMVQSLSTQPRERRTLDALAAIPFYPPGMTDDERRERRKQGLGWQWREPFERLPTTQTEIYERCYAAERVRREP